jgi:hypothetical protein
MLEDGLDRRYARLLTEIRRDVGELIKTGVMEPARDLSDRTGLHFNASEWPLFFTGDPNSQFVLVHLNPKEKDSTGPFASRGRYKDVDDYIAGHQRYGARTYGAEATSAHKSPFDHKQLRFARPFGAIAFVEEQGRADRLVNLERVIDRKLQLELVPYGSDNFRARRRDADALRPHFERVLQTIVAAPREYVIFCGSVFESFLSPYVEDVEAFSLSKGDDGVAQYRVRFANLVIPWEDKIIRAGLAHSWPMQGLNMSAYAEEIKKRYRP